MPDGIVLGVAGIEGVDTEKFLATQTRFDSKYRPLYKLSFRETVERRLRGETLRTIAKAAGITYQGMSLVDQRYLQHLFGGRAGELRSREKQEREIKQVTDKKRALALQLRGEPFREILGFCKQEKLVVKLEVFGNHRTLVIAKRRWRFHHLRCLWKASKQSPRSYFHAFLEEWPPNYAGDIFLTEHGDVRWVFAIPQRDIRARFLGGSSGSLYFPEKREKSKEGCRPRLNVWNYERALHFLRPDFQPDAALAPCSD